MIKCSRRTFSIMERYRLSRPVAMDLTNQPPLKYQKEESENKWFFKSSSYIRSPVPTSAKLFAQSLSFKQPANPRRLRVALVGAPNAGKTSLLNRVLNQPVGAVSSKKNTTRESIVGILTQENVQLEFVDCPGILPYDGTTECKELTAEAWKNFNDSDVAIFIVDTVKKPCDDMIRLIRKICGRESIIDEFRSFHAGGGNEQSNSKPVVLVLNKRDLVEDEKWLKVRNLQLSSHGKFDSCFYVSSITGQGCERLVKYLQSKSQRGEWQYAPDTVSTLSMTEQLEQLVRSCLFTWFNRDVPYKIKQQTVGWTERLDGTLIIEHELIVKDSIVARMVLGTKNRLLSRLRENVVYKLKKLWKMDKVVLLIHVKALEQRKSKRDKIIEAKKSNLDSFLSRGSGAH
jgi:GTP-binding protein Era